MSPTTNVDEPAELVAGASRAAGAEFAASAGVAAVRPPQRARPAAASRSRGLESDRSTGSSFVVRSGPPSVVRAALCSMGVIGICAATASNRNNSETFAPLWLVCGYIPPSRSDLKLCLDRPASRPLRQAPAPSVGQGTARPHRDRRLRL